MKLSLSLLLGAFVIACAPSQSQNTPTHEPQDQSLFNEYWYAGEAEISSYALEQSRYGEIHRGTAVTVFVTEPFSKSKQVKLDDWRDTSTDNVSVLKLNMTKKFLTGIYPYSMMMSTFTPVASSMAPAALKVTTSSQEWCGHTFMQLNKGSNGYGIQAFSYFESEGDVETSVQPELLEDELWTQIRLNTAPLPQGKFQVLPATFYLRLKHKEAKAVEAELTLEEVEKSAFSEEPHLIYQIVYADRTLVIYFEEQFPRKIVGWEESYNGLATTARLMETIKSPYWSKNGNENRVLRKDLGLRTE